MASTQLAVKSPMMVADELVFNDEGSVRKHYDLAIGNARSELATKANTLIQTYQQQVRNKSNLMAWGVGIIAVVVAGLTISTIITGIVGLGLLASAGIGATVLKFRYPVWVAKMRAKQVVDLARAEYDKEIQLIEAQNAYINKLRAQAKNDPIATRHRIANETATEIDEATTAASDFEGLFRTQGKNITEAKKNFPKANFTDEEAMQAEMSSAIETMRTDIEQAAEKLNLYVQQTQLIETKVKLAAGARSMAEFLRDDSGKDRIRAMVSSIATEESENEFQTSMSALRASVTAAKRRIQQQQ